MAERAKVYVKISASTTWLYGFRTPLDAAERTALGQTDVGASTTGVIFGVNSPKPARLRKTLSSGRSSTSYCDYNSQTSAIAAGWKLVKPATARVFRATNRSVPVYVSVAAGNINFKYVWQMRKDLYDAIATDRPTLKILDASTETDPFDLVYGALTKPPRAKKEGAIDRITFYDATAALPTTWTSVGGQRITR